jgi:hypothetical protein
VAEPRRHDEDGESPVVKEAEVVARGRAARTPFIAIGSVALLVWAAAALLTLVLFLVIWLV